MVRAAHPLVFTMTSSLVERKTSCERRSNRLRPRVEGVESRTLPASGQPIVVAALGDSLTDEYSFQNPSPLGNPSAATSPSALASNFTTFGRNSARNWVENLAATRSSQMTFGAYSTTSRGEVRNQGYAENWARGGTTASGPNIDGSGTTFAEEYLGSPNRSLPGLLTQTVANSGYSPKDINVVTISIGTNDYGRGLAEYVRSGGRIDVFDAKSLRDPNPINAQVEGSIKTAVARIRHPIPKAKIILITPPDITATPMIEAALATQGASLPGLVGKVSGSLKKLGDDLSAFARGQKLGLVNTQAVENQIRSSPTIDGVTVNLQGSGQDITDGFVDGFHPGTIVQGRIAQAIVARIDAMSGSQVINPLTDAEIVGFARASRPTLALSLSTPSGLASSPGSVLEAVVSPGPGNTSVPTGSVTFRYPDPAASTSTATLAEVDTTVLLDGSGRATSTIAPTPVNPGWITAVYSGDVSNEARSSTLLGTAVLNNLVGKS